MRELWKKEKSEIILLLGYTVIALLFCAGSSPLINQFSPDSNIFYVMGRSMAAGKVLYRDVADHKGFYLFLLNAIGAWMTPGRMLGMFVVEIVFGYIKVLAVYKIAKLYLKESHKAVLASLLLFMVSLNYFTWGTGNLGEQYALAFQLIGFYYIAKYWEKRKASIEHPPIYMFIHGVCSGIILFIQPNLLAMWIPFGAILAFDLLRNKKIRNFLYNLLTLISGVIIVAIPPVAYGIYHRCLQEMYTIMIEVNFLYSKDGRIGKTLGGYIKEFVCCPSFLIAVLGILGCIVVCRYYRERFVQAMMIAMYVFCIICMSVSLNANPIYYCTYVPFAIPFILYVVQKWKLQKWYYCQIAILLLCTIICNLQMVKVVLKKGAANYAYESAKEMSTLIGEEDTVLVLGESLYYNALDKLPPVRHFTIFGSGLKYETYPYCIDEQHASAISGENDYIIIQLYGEAESFWGEEWREQELQQALKRDYQKIHEYNNGGIHTMLMKNKNK